jgi:DNA-binding CsgD family transcriptional regulator
MQEGSDVDAERQWLELMGHVMAAPLTVLPEEHIAAALKATFDAPACCFHTRADPHTVVQRIYPPTMFSAELQAEWLRLAVEEPTRHPLLRYYLATADLTPQQVADVPPRMAGPWARAHWAELSRGHGIEHQLAIPLPLSTEGLRWFVLGRAEAFEAERMHLARRVQKLIAGLDRQAAALRQWQRRAPQPNSAAVATDVRLTPRELSVLTLVADGLTAAAVARRLVVAERTVHKHLERAYAKLGVSDRVSAVLRAQRLGILPETVLALAR